MHRDTQIRCNVADNTRIAKRPHRIRRTGGDAYGGLDEWKAAEVLSTVAGDANVELRIDSSDGKAYRKEDFEIAYGGLQEWNAATPFGVGDAAGDVTDDDQDGQDEDDDDDDVLDPAVVHEKLVSALEAFVEGEGEQSDANEEFTLLLKQVPASMLEYAPENGSSLLVKYCGMFALKKNRKVRG